MTATIMTIFLVVYVGMILGGLPFLQLDRTGVALLGAIAMIGVDAVTLDEAAAAVHLPTLILFFSFMVLSAQMRLGGLYAWVTEGIALLALSPPQLLGAPVADERLSRRFLLEHQLRAAAARGQLRLHFQPLVELDTGTIGRVETLLRWQHPELGLLPPDDFIPLAEETGVIVGIGEWVLREACERLLAWRQAGLTPLRIAVNVSPVQLRQRDFTQRTRAILADYPGVAPWLELEITETSLVQAPEETAALLGELKSLGLRIAIDDFGTGYSALGTLRQLPIDSLKVARTFVAGLADQADDRAIALTIIALARNLDLKVVAEGVETHGQLAFLRENRCRTVQGYYFSRPLPEEELLELLRDGGRTG